MAKCDICNKGVTFGIQVSHSHRRSNRTWKPNVRRVKAMVDGTPAISTYVLGASVPARLPALSDFNDLCVYVEMPKRSVRRALFFYPYSM